MTLMLSQLVPIVGGDYELCGVGVKEWSIDEVIHAEVYYEYLTFGINRRVLCDIPFGSVFVAMENPA